MIFVKKKKKKERKKEKKGRCCNKCVIEQFCLREKRNKFDENAFL